MNFFTVAAAIVRAFTAADASDPIVRIAYADDRYTVTTANDTFHADVYSDADELVLDFFSSRSLVRVSF